MPKDAKGVGRWKDTKITAKNPCTAFQPQAVVFTVILAIVRETLNTLKCLERLSVEQEFGGHDFISCDGHASHSSDLKSYPLQRSPDVSDHSGQVLAEFCPLAQLHSH